MQDQEVAFLNDWLDNALVRQGLPGRFRECSWDNFSTASLPLEIVKRIDTLIIWRGKPEMVSIIGPPGTGKTHMAAATMRRLVSKQSQFISHPARFITVSDMLERLRNEVQDETFGPTLMHQLKNVYLLILDDLGTEKQTEWTLDRMNALISYRYNSLLPTMFTTNHPLNWIAENVDPRLASRMAGGLVISTQGLNDRRVGGVDRTP